MIKKDNNGQVDLGWFEIVIQILIFLCLFAFALETLPDLTESQRSILRNFEIFSVVVFTFEYLARLVFSTPKGKYALGFYGIIDLLAILPFYVGLGIDLRPIRGFRFLRLFRILKLTRYSKAMRRFHRAFLITKEEIVLFLVTAFILFYLAGVGIYYFENEAQPKVFRSIFDGLWWAVATLTTVGYGDVYPITAGGRIFTFFILLIGLGIIAVPTGMVASALSKARQEEEDEQSDDK